MNVYYDLHMHSCLSPCGADDMTPNNLVNMAALAGLHPLDFDPDEKWHVAAGVGNYGSLLARFRGRCRVGICLLCDGIVINIAYMALAIGAIIAACNKELRDLLLSKFSK